MTKRELIDRITRLNPSAAPGFLAGFDDTDLAEYLQHLKWVVSSDGPAQASEGFRVAENAPLFAPAGLSAVSA